MTWLHIQHPITDLKTWTKAFDSFSEVRRQAGVIAESIRHPVGEDTYVVVDLEFDTNEKAYAFLQFLRTQVWANPDNSPALVGQPDAKVLELVTPSD